MDGVNSQIWRISIYSEFRVQHFQLVRLLSWYLQIGPIVLLTLSNPRINYNNVLSWEVVVAQLEERSLPIPEVRGSNPVTAKNLLILNHYCILSTVY